MYKVGVIAVVVLVIFLGFFMGSAITSAVPVLQKSDYSAPRYPRIHKITSTDELMPQVRYVLERGGEKKGDRSFQMRPGYGIKGGERILVVASSLTDPLVIQAFLRGFKEKNCLVDLIVVGSTYKGLSEISGVNEISRGFEGGRNTGRLVREFAEKGGHSLIVGMTQSVGEASPGFGALRMHWSTRELLASPSTMYPDEILQAAEDEAWQMLRQTAEVRVTDPEGTDLGFTWFPEYWQVIDGTHPTIKTIGGGPLAGSYGGHPYYAGASEEVLIPGHLMGYPLGVALDKSNGAGTVAGTANHAGLFPHLKLTMKNNRLTSVEGGGEYGRLWQAKLEKTKDIKYPLFPQPGLFYLIEIAVGTHPKIPRPHNVMESLTAKATWSYERMRSGIIHVGIGNILYENQAWAASRRLPGDHHHVHLYFPTLVAKLRGGRQVNLVDKGRLTVLDDSRVRNIAAKHGNPDDLLREDWIPAIPGINVKGDYVKDYGNDPEAWVKKEHREAFGAILDFRPYE